MRHPLNNLILIILAGLFALVVVGTVCAGSVEAASPPLPGTSSRGSAEVSVGTAERAGEMQMAAPLDIPSTGITVTVDIPLTAGWNLVAVPVKRTPAHTAQSALNEIAGQGGACSEVNRWLNGGWDAFINGLPFNNFSLEPGKGYFVRCTTASTWSMTGELIMAPVPLELTPGWNLVALPYGPHADLAQAWLNDIIAQGGAATEVNRWLNGGWDAFINGLPFNNFAIAKTQGYFIRMGNGVSYVPKPPTQTACGAISADVTWTSDKIWQLTCDVTVNANVTLTIEPETVVKPQSTSVGLTVNGTLRGQGAELARMVVTSYKDDRFGGDSNNDAAATLPARGDWEGIYVGSTGRVELGYAGLLYGGNTATAYDAALYLVNNAVGVLDRVIVAGSGYRGIYAHASSSGTTPTLTFSNGVVEDSANTGIYAARGSGVGLNVGVTNSVIRNSGSYGFHMPYANGVELTGNTFTDNAGQAVYLGFSWF